MRKSAVEEEEAKVFNDTLYELKEWCQLSNKTSSRQGFWKLLKSKSITIITSEEAKDTHIKGVTVKDAEKFFEEDKPEAVPVTVTDENLSDDDFNVDDLIDQMDF
ncbi:hypothetical protein G6F56_007364 [Rhizopus delemar]|nr:hypothetical protein G6F56_007364 [Rhizopus delemar]